MPDQPDATAAPPEHPPEPIRNSLTGSSADLWRQLVRASVDRRHPWRVVAFCTQGAEGPSARHVILRKVHEATRQLVFYTDRRTAKLRELGACQQVALLLWDGPHRQQLRLSGCATEVVDAQRVQQHWAQVPEAARRDYGTVSAPGTPLLSETASGPELDLMLAREHFVVLAVEVREMEWLQLGRDRHHRNRHLWDPVQHRWQVQALVP